MLPGFHITTKIVLEWNGLKKIGYKGVIGNRIHRQIFRSFATKQTRTGLFLEGKMGSIETLLLWLMLLIFKMGEITICLDAHENNPVESKNN